MALKQGACGCVVGKARGCGDDGKFDVFLNGVMGKGEKCLFGTPHLYPGHEKQDAVLRDGGGGEGLYGTEIEG